MESTEQSNVLAIHSRIREFHEEEKYYDITIRVGAKTFKCHQLLLCASSDYFDRMFSGDFKESNIGKDNPVELQGVDSAAFNEVLNFIYNGKLLITDSNYYELIRASDFLQLRVPYIEKQCIDYLQNIVVLKSEPIANAIEVFHFARASSRELLLGILAEHIFRHLKHFSREPEFLNLLYNDFNLILECKRSFSCINEDLLMETISQWLNHSDSEERGKWRQELMTYVDKSKLSPQYVLFLIESYMNLMARQLPEKTMEPFQELIKHIDTSKLAAPIIAPFVNEYVNHKKENDLIEKGHNDDRRRAYYDVYPFDSSSLAVKDDMTLQVLTYYKERHGSSIFSLNETSVSNCEWLHSWGQEFSVNFEEDYILFRGSNIYYPKSRMRVIKVGNAFYQLSYCYKRSAYIDFGIQDSIHRPITKFLKHPPSTICNIKDSNLEVCGNNHEDNNINLYNQNQHLLQYNCKLDQWFSIQVPLSHIPDGLSSNYAACLVADNLVYVTGKTVNRGHLNFNVAYDSRMNEWLQLPTEFYSWSWHSSETGTNNIGDICVHQGKLYAVYRMLGNTGFYIIGYDSRAQKWVEISKLNDEVAEKIYNARINAAPRMISYRNELWMFSTDKRFNVVKYDFTSGKSQDELYVQINKIHCNTYYSIFLDAIVC